MGVCGCAGRRGVVAVYRGGTERRTHGKTRGKRHEDVRPAVMVRNRGCTAGGTRCEARACVQSN